MRIGARVLLLLILPVASARAEEPGAFVGRLCAALGQRDAAFLRRHVRLPLLARLIVSENRGNPVTRTRRLRTVTELVGARLCHGLALETARVTKIRDAWRVVAEVGQFDAALDLRRGAPGLVLIRYMQPAPR